MDEAAVREIVGHWATEGSTAFLRSFAQQAVDNGAIEAIEIVIATIARGWTTCSECEQRAARIQWYAWAGYDLHEEA